MDEIALGYDLFLIVDQFSKSKKSLVKMAKQCFQNEIDFEVPFTEEQKDKLRENMIKLIENQHKLQAYRQMQEQLNSKLQAFAADTNLHSLSMAELIEHVHGEDHFDELYEQTLEENPPQVEHDEHFKALISFFGEEKEREVDEDIEEIDEGFTIPKDPFTRRFIEEPVQNKICKHIYEKQAFLDRFVSSQKTEFKCPVAGCSNTRVTIDDVFDDLHTKGLIESAKNQANDDSD